MLRELARVRGDTVPFQVRRRGVHAPCRREQRSAREPLQALGRAGPQSQVEALVREIDDGVGRSDVEFDLGMLLEHPSENREQPLAGEARRGADPDAAGAVPVPRFRQVRAHPFKAPHQAPASIQELLALAAEGQGVRRAMEEPDAMLRL